MNQFESVAFDNLQSVQTAAAPSAAARTVAVMDLTDAYASASSESRTTAVGLEAWMAGAHDGPKPEPEPGPVNLAEALCLDPSSAIAMRISDAEGKQIVVDPERNAYYFASTSLKPMTELLQQPVTAMQPIYSAALNTVREGTAQPLVRLRWFAGLVATPGILGRRLESGSRYKLARWGETEREFPKHFRIAKAMMKGPATAEEIATSANVPLEDVIDYINASHAAGRLHVEAKPAPVEEETPAPSRRSALMAKLNKPLFAR